MTTNNKSLTPHGSEVETVLRFPRLNPDGMTPPQAIEDRVARLDAAVFRGMAGRERAVIEIGRALNEEKALLNHHGDWMRHFEETFAPRGLTLRSAERYMKRATEEDSPDKIDSLSNFKLAADRGAKEMRNATQAAEAEVFGVPPSNAPTKRPRLFNLSLRMTEAEMVAVSALRKSKEWPRAEKRIVRSLKELCVRYQMLSESGVVYEDNTTQE